MSQALRIAPPSSHPKSTTNTTATSAPSAPSAPGLHDTLRSNLSLHPGAPNTPSSSSSSTTNTAPLQSTHPLESRLAAWQSTQTALKMNLLRRNHGIGEPVRRGMELQICKEGEWRPTVLGGSANVGGDILSGRDTEMGWEDVYGKQGEGVREGVGMHEEMEGKVGMGKW